MTALADQLIIEPALPLYFIESRKDLGSGPGPLFKECHFKCDNWFLIRANGLWALLATSPPFLVQSFRNKYCLVSKLNGWLNGIILI